MFKTENLIAESLLSCRKTSKNIEFYSLVRKFCPKNDHTYAVRDRALTCNIGCECKNWVEKKIICSAYNTTKWKKKMNDYVKWKIIHLSNFQAEIALDDITKIDRYSPVKLTILNGLIQNLKMIK